MTEQEYIKNLEKKVDILLKGFHAYNNILLEKLTTSEISESVRNIIINNEDIRKAYHEI